MIVTVIVMVAVRIWKNLFICMHNGCICGVNNGGGGGNSGCGGSCVAHHPHAVYI